MAFGDQNINIQYPNFCLSPQAGVFGTVNTSAVDTIVRFKNESGGFIADYDLDTDISASNELLAIEYVGPLGLSGFEDGLTFFTLEKESPTKCLIKRWETNTTSQLLELKQTIIKTTSAGIYYEATGFAVEHYRRTLDANLPAGQNYFDVSSSSRMESGDIILLGPSTDFDNTGVYENVTVDYIDGDRVYITASGVQYDYVDGDGFTFFNNIYLISDRGYLGDTRYGNIIKLGAYTGTVKEYNTSGAYKAITGARWYTSAASVACIRKSQLIFIRPYESYQNWRSIFLNNITDATGNYFEIYDVVFNIASNLLYKLSDKTMGKDDDGTVTMYNWVNYNIQEQSLLPYTQSISIYTSKQTIIGPGYTYLYVQARDQYGVGLLDVNVQFYMDAAHTGAEFDPLNGVAVTDSNGEAYIKYSFTPPAFPTFPDTPSTIRVRVDKSSSTSTGSEYVWDDLIMFSENLSTIDLDEAAVRQIFSNDISYPNDGRLYQINDPFVIQRYPRGAGAPFITVPDYYLLCVSIFGSPLGAWIDGGFYVKEDMPWYSKNPQRTDGPRQFAGKNWECVSWPALVYPDTEAGACPTSAYSPRPHIITQVLEKTQFGINPKYYTYPEPRPEIGDSARPFRLFQPEWYWIYKNAQSEADMEDGEPIYVTLVQFFEFISTLQMSQLKLSKHTHYVNNNPYDYLFTNTTLDQFIFVEDADPAFFSFKNPIQTDIWIRLRPFAFNLDNTTLKFYIREVWSVGDHIYDTGYYDVADDGTITNFDAGGGLLGIEFLYDPPENFHHGGIVYVHIEVYDEAAEPNFIYVDYWFRLIADYNTPYLVNLNPDREEDYVSTTTNLYFEIKDDGAGVNIDTLEVYLNSRIIYHADYAATHPELNLDTTITEVSLNHYIVSIDIPYDLYYDKMYTVKVIVDDISPSANTLRDSYRFYTRPSEAPIFTGFDPRLCKRGMPRFTDVSFLVLADGNGVDRDTIRLQVHDKDVPTTSMPILYRAVGPEFNPNPLSLQISNISLEEDDYITTTSGTLCVDVTDYNYNVVTSGTYFTVDSVTSSGIFTTISGGYNMCYGPTPDLVSLAGPTIFTVHAENDNSDSVEVSFYVTSGYIVEFNHRVDPYDYDKQVVVRASAENLASCPEIGVDAYWFTTVPRLGKDLGASIVGVPWGESNLGASITPNTGTIYFYGKIFNIEVRAKDLAGNEMQPYIFEFRIEDKPD